MSYSCKILAIDGGGIRGVIPAYILAQLETALGKPIYQCFDIIAGTSTGGLIALGLTTPKSSGQAPWTAQEVQDFYTNDEAQLFVYQASGDYEDAKYWGTKVNTSGPDTGIEPWLQSIFGSTTLSQAQQWINALGTKIPAQVLTTCYTLSGAEGANFGPYQFSWLGANSNPGNDYCIWEAARATSAAPTYFPIANIGAGATNGSQAVQRWACDGGVTANNPALYGLANAFALNLCDTLSDALVVSLGTGVYSAGISVPNQGNWGAIPWGTGTDVNGNLTDPLINVLAMSNQLAPDQQLRMIMRPENYMRFEPVLTYGESSLDGTDVSALQQIASSYIGDGGAGHWMYQNIVQALA